MITAEPDGRGLRLLGLLDDTRVCTPGPARPRRRPMREIADKACSQPSIHPRAPTRGIKVTIPERDDDLGHRRAHGPSRSDTVDAFDAESDKHRHVVERCFNRLKRRHAIATSHGRTAATTAAESRSPASCPGPADEPRDAP